MAKKKKRGKIRPLAQAIIRQGDRLFVAENYDEVKQETFYRLLGGRIEFGEWSHETVIRELQEEINAAVVVRRYVGTLETIFTYAGQPGHEIIMFYEAEFADPAMYNRDAVEGYDDNELLFVSYWKPFDFFEAGHAPLYPEGLLDLLRDFAR